MQKKQKKTVQRIQKLLTDGLTDRRMDGCTHARTHPPTHKPNNNQQADRPTDRPTNQTTDQYNNLDVLVSFLVENKKKRREETIFDYKGLWPDFYAQNE